VHKTYVASLEMRVSNPGGAIGIGLFALGYGLIKMYMQVTLDPKRERIESDCVCLELTT
jgi:hypothetical protein